MKSIEEIWEELKTGFCPWQTAPFTNAMMFGSPEKGICYVVTHDYPSLGERNGVQYYRCAPENCTRKVLRAIDKSNRDMIMTDTMFDIWQQLFEPADTAEDRFVLPDGETVVPGDYVEMTYKFHYLDTPKKIIVMVCDITMPDFFHDTQGSGYLRDAIISARKVTDSVTFKDREPADLVKMRKNMMNSRQIFARADSGTEGIRIRDILIDGKPTDYILVTPTVETDDDETREEPHIFNRSVLGYDRQVNKEN